MSSQTNNASPPPASENDVACCSCCGAIITIVAISLFLLFIDTANSHPKFTIQSITVEDSSSTWHIDFLVKNPISRYSVYYDDVAVMLGPLNTAVLNISSKHRSRYHTAFSLAFVAEDKRKDDVDGQLDIKLRGKHKGYIFVFYDEAGVFDIKCRDLTSSHENIKKIKCHSSFISFDWF